jgi:hypothetical protein
LEEIVQLHVADIRQDDGVWCFDINDRGGREARQDRMRGSVSFPIHPFLFNDLGLSPVTSKA